MDIYNKYILQVLRKIRKMLENVWIKKILFHNIL